MNTTTYYRLGTLPKAILAFFIGLSILLLSCKDDNQINGFFELKDNPSAMNVVADGSSQTYTVQASGSWKVQPLRKEHWYKI